MATTDKQRRAEDEHEVTDQLVANENEAQAAGAPGAGYLGGDAQVKFRACCSRASR